MYKDTDKYAFPNKWIAQDFEKLQDLCEACNKARREKVTENCPAFESERKKTNDKCKRSKT